MVSALFITFLVCLAVGVPVAFSLGIASCVYFLGAHMPIVQFAQRFFAGMDSFTLLCIPGFTLAGNLMNQGGISATCAAASPTPTSWPPWSSPASPAPPWPTPSHWAASRSR